MLIGKKEYFSVLFFTLPQNDRMWGIFILFIFLYFFVIVNSEILWTYTVWK